MAALDNLPCDGEITPKVGPWAQQKYELVYHYARMFSTSMKRRFPERVYIDLFAGAGHAQIRGTRRIVGTSPMRALSVPYPFTRYIFCERDQEQIAALERRVRRDFGGLTADYVPGDCNREIGHVLGKIPTPRSGQGVLTFCFVDPWCLNDLRFATLCTLATYRWVDFLILVPTGMDTTRWAKKYLRPGDNVVGEFLGDPDWREKVPKPLSRWSQVSTLVVKQLEAQFRAMGYGFGGFSSSRLVRSTDKNLALYRLVFFSRHERGLEFWEAAKKSESQQGSLDFSQDGGS